MDGRNWLVVNMPEGLRYILEQYRSDRKLRSFSATVKELLETHPEVVSRVNQIYNGPRSENGT